jgi:hypothetical protein
VGKVAGEQMNIKRLVTLERNRTNITEFARQKS